MGPAESNPRKWSAARRCSRAACAEVESVDGGVRLTSTIPGTGALTYTSDEFRVLRDAIKAGELDFFA